MNKFILGLLLIAAAAGIFFVLQKKKGDIASEQLKKEVTLGKWKITSYDAKSDSSDLFVGIMALVDSNTLKYEYKFTREGSILRSLNDSFTKDTSYYHWINKKLAWRQTRFDSANILHAHIKKDTMRLQADDSTVIVFTRLK